MAFGDREDYGFPMRRVPLCSGVYLYYTAPAQAAFLGALRHSLCPKDYIQQTWSDIDTPLLSTGMATKYTYDRAKFNLTETTINNLSANNLNADWTKVKTPWGKWIIESVNAEIANRIVDGLPGAMLRDPQLFREYDSKKHRVVTSETFFADLPLSFAGVRPSSFAFGYIKIIRASIAGTQTGLGPGNA